MTDAHFEVKLLFGRRQDHLEHQTEHLHLNSTAPFQESYSFFQHPWVKILIIHFYYDSYRLQSSNLLNKSCFNYLNKNSFWSRIFGINCGRFSCFLTTPVISIMPSTCPPFRNDGFFFSFGTHPRFIKILSLLIFYVRVNSVRYTQKIFTIEEDFLLSALQLKWSYN